MNRTLTVIISLLLVLGIGYVLYTSLLGGKVNPDIVAKGYLDNPSLVAGREFLAALSNLKTLKLDDGLFSSRDFGSLRDFSSTIEPQPKGRINPFAPLGGD